MLVALTLLCASTVVKAAPQACQPMSDLAAGRGIGSLKLCSGRLPDRQQSCPTSGQIVVIVDNDNSSAAARTTGSDQATDWRDFVEELLSVGSIECGAGERPLERLPGSCGTIQSLARGSQLGSCRNAAGKLFPRFIGGGEGNTTPATEVIGRIERKLTGVTSTTGVVFLAFDGVVDGDYRDASPHLAFADAVKRALGEKLPVFIVASPVDFRYVYVFARPQFQAFAGKAADALAEAWRKKRGQRLAVVNLSETGFRDPERRAATAHLAIGQLPATGNHWTASGLNLFERKQSGTSARMWQVGIERWLGQYAAGMDAMGGGVELTWDAKPSSWDALVPFGLRLPPPQVLVNYTVASADEAVKSKNGAWVSAPLIKVGKLDKCDVRRTGTSNAPFAQAGSFAPGRADFVFIRGAVANATWLRTEAVPSWPASANALLQGLPASANGPLPAAVLVTPSAEPSPCTRRLLNRFEGAHRWRGEQATPELADIAQLPDCAGGAWSEVIAALQKVRYRRFNTGANTPWPASDSRVSVVTFLTVAEKAATLAMQSQAQGDACVLATLQVVSHPDPDPQHQWQPVPLR